MSISNQSCAFEIMTEYLIILIMHSIMSIFKSNVEIIIYECLHYKSNEENILGA